MVIDETFMTCVTPKSTQCKKSTREKSKLFLK